MKIGERYIYKGNVIIIVYVNNQFVHFKLQGSNTKNYALKEFFNKTFIPFTELNMALS